MGLVVVTGNVCSGKSTYVRQHAQPGDLVVDTDTIARALGSPVEHGHEDTLRYVAVKARNTAVKEAVKVSDRLDVWVIDSCIPQWRADLYERHNARTVLLEVDKPELHRRARAERPDLWHTLIDDWAPRQEDAGPSWRTPWPGALSQSAWRRDNRTPDYRSKAKGTTYARLRAQFLSQHTNCQRCGDPFVTDAPCDHPACLRRGKGCYRHPFYPSVQHMAPLVETQGAGTLDTSTWQAWHLYENTGEGGRIGHARRRARTHARQGYNDAAYTDLAW